MSRRDRKKRQRRKQAAGESELVVGESLLTVAIQPWLPKRTAPATVPSPSMEVDNDEVPLQAGRQGGPKPKGLRLSSLSPVSDFGDGDKDMRESSASTDRDEPEEDEDEPEEEEDEPEEEEEDERNEDSEFEEEEPSTPRRRARNERRSLGFIKVSFLDDLAEIAEAPPFGHYHERSL